MEVIQFFPDTGAEHPLSDEDGALYDLDDLPLSDDLRTALQDWADEASWPDNYISRPERLAELQRSGQQLCARTSQELGPAFDVRWRWEDGQHDRGR